MSITTNIESSFTIDLTTKQPMLSDVRLLPKVSINSRLCFSYLVSTHILLVTIDQPVKGV